MSQYSAPARTKEMGSSSSKDSASSTSLATSARYSPPTVFFRWACRVGSGSMMSTVFNGVVEAMPTADFGNGVSCVIGRVPLGGTSLSDARETSAADDDKSSCGKGFLGERVKISSRYRVDYSCSRQENVLPHPPPRKHTLNFPNANATESEETCFGPARDIFMTPQRIGVLVNRLRAFAFA